MVVSSENYCSNDGACNSLRNGRKHFCGFVEELVRFDRNRRGNGTRGSP